MASSPEHDRRWAVVLALAACACAEPRKLTLRIAQGAAAAPADAGPPDAQLPYCMMFGGPIDRERTRHLLYNDAGTRDLCVAFVVHPEGDQRELLQVYAVRTRELADRMAPPCFGALGNALASALGDEADYLAHVAVIDLNRRGDDYLLTSRPIPRGDDAQSGSWCLDAFRCSRLIGWVHDEVVRRCEVAPRVPGDRCTLSQESEAVCPLPRGTP